MSVRSLGPQTWNSALVLQRCGGDSFWSRGAVSVFRRGVLLAIAVAGSDLSGAWPALYTHTGGSINGVFPDGLKARSI